MAITTSSVLSAPVQQSFDDKLLAVPTPDFIHKFAAMRKKLNANSGTTLRMRRYNPLNSALVPLGPSGVTPPSQELTAVDIDAKMDFYGTYVQIHEQVTLQNQDPVLNEAAKRLGVALRQSEDELTRNMLASTASAVNCVGGVNGDSPTEITRSDVDGVVRVLRNNNAKTMMHIIEGEDKFGTAPVRDAYFALGNTNLIGQLDNVSGFINKAQYPSSTGLQYSEWGAIGNLRFFLSSIGSVSNNASNLNQNVYNIFCVGLEAYACVEQNNYSANFIYRPPSVAGGPLGLYATAGFKFAEVPRITNDLWVINLRCTLA